MEDGDEYYAFGEGMVELGLFRFDIIANNYLVFKFAHVARVRTDDPSYRLPDPQAEFIPIVIIDFREEFHLPIDIIKRAVYVVNMLYVLSNRFIFLEGQKDIFGIYNELVVGSDVPVSLSNRERIFPLRIVFPEFLPFSVEKSSTRTLLTLTQMGVLKKPSTFVDKQYHFMIFRRNLGRMIGDGLKASGNTRSFIASMNCSLEEFIYLAEERDVVRNEIYFGPVRRQCTTLMHTDSRIRTVSQCTEDLIFTVNTVYELWPIIGKHFSFWPGVTRNQSYAGQTSLYKCISFLNSEIEVR
jgi:hypothetical protein